VPRRSNKSNASTHVLAEVLANCQVYSWQQIHSAADLVILVGKFGKEDNNDNIDCQKLLVACMQSMISKSISDDDVKSMYSNIAPIAGLDVRDMRLQELVLLVEQPAPKAIKSSLRVA
jgi:hypothetical protein